MTGHWSDGFQTGDVINAVQYGKGIGCIADSTLGGSAASVDLTSIVGSYAHLWLIVYSRGDAAAASVLANLRFNGDTAADYDFQQLQGNISAVNPSETFAATSALAGYSAAATAGANLFSVTTAFIPHYAGTSNNKVAISLSSMKVGTSSGNMAVVLTGGFWRSSAAISRITVLPSSGNWVAGTRVSLYGLGA